MNKRELDLEANLDMCGGHLVRANYKGEPDPEGKWLACKHCHKVWWRKFAWARIHLLKKHNVAWWEGALERIRSEKGGVADGSKS